MASPFAMEEDSQLQGRPTFDPAAQPKTPAWYAGLGYDDTGYPQALNVLESGVLQGVAKGQAVLGGALHRDTDLDYSIDPQGGLVARDTGETPDNTIADAISADAKAKIKAFTPDANTTGAAAQILHGVVSGATEMAIGGLAGGPVGAGVAVGSGEGVQRYNELIDAGVDPATAREAAGVTSVAAGLGAFLPGGIGGSLAAKVASGAAANTVFGMVNRYADHKILENAGYDAMADQQKVIDGTQVLTDFILGAAFGGLAHLHSPEIEQLRDAPGARDAALTTNLALADRRAAPGIPADPEAANAHQDALQAGIESLIRGREVDVSESGVTGADFVARDTQAQQEAMIELLHGSRHTFTEFNASKIGSGQGNNAFGKGLYLTDNAEAAQTYATAGMGGEILTDAQAERYFAPGRTVYTGRHGWGEVVSYDRANSEVTMKFGDETVKFKAADSMVSRQMAAQELNEPENGNVYRVHVPSSTVDKMAHNDKAIGAQGLPEAVVSELAKNQKNGRDTLFAHAAAAYPEWQKLLEKHGVSGVVYQGHEGGATARTMNYVLFNPEEARIISRNDMPLIDLFGEDNARDVDALLSGGKRPEPEEVRTAPEKPEEGAPVEKSGETQPKAPTQEPEGEREAGASNQDDTARILADRPDLTIPDENGNPIKASDALKAANEDLAIKTRESKIAAETAISCYLRRGN